MADTELPNPDELLELKEKPFTKRIALTTAVFAVCLAIVSLGGNNAMKEMLLAQQQSPKQWSFYQAKVVREHLYRNQKMRLELDLAVAGESLSPANRQRMEETLKQFSAEEERYRTEKKEIEQEAKNLERERDINRAKDPYFDYAGAHPVSLRRGCAESSGC
ncbi:MAG TPA: DUF4337 domain-containing protein [Candidatus Methylomirabilis sp.]